MKKNFITFNAIALFIFLVIILNSVAKLTFASELEDEFWLILISFGLLGILIQFYFINKKLSD